MDKAIAETPDTPPETLEDRLGHLSKLIGESTLLAEQVSAELEPRAAAAQRLQEKADETVALAALEHEEADEMGVEPHKLDHAIWRYDRS